MAPAEERGLHSESLSMMARLAPRSRLNPEDLFQTMRTAVAPRVTVAIPTPSHLHRRRWHNSMPLHSKINCFAHFTANLKFVVALGLATSELLTEYAFTVTV
jgi:hypothetical protein